MDHRELLAGLIVLLYLSDCVRLLQPGQAALATSGGGHWRVRFGASRMALAGKDPLLANPFDPAELLFLVQWRATRSPGQGEAAPGAEQLRAAASALNAPGWLCRLSWALALLALPASLLLQLGPVPVIACAGALYANIAITGLVIYLRRDRLGVSAGRVAKLWAESVLCAPFGANMARKLALALPTKDALLAELGGQLLDDEHKPQAWAACHERLLELMAEFDEGSPEHEALKAEAAGWRSRR